MQGSFVIKRFYFSIFVLFFVLFCLNFCCYIFKSVPSQAVCVQWEWKVLSFVLSELISQSQTTSQKDTGACSGKII